MSGVAATADGRWGTGCFAGVDFARGRLFETSDAEEARSLCARVFNPHRLTVLGPRQVLSSRMDHLPLGPLSLNRLTWGARVHVDPDRLGTYYLVSVPVRGAARFQVGARQVEVTPRRACVISAHERFRFEADAQFDQIVVRLEKPQVDAAWLALTGAPPAGPVELEPALPLDGTRWQALAPALRLLAACASGDYAPALEAHVRHRVHDMLLTALLLHLAPALAARPTPRLRTGAALVQRTQAYLLERSESPLSLADAARAAGVAARTLQAAFQSECGVGPMQWLREQRLAAVHRALCEVRDPGVRVTDTAYAHGFSHLGEFGRAYRARFGETPGQTLARRR